MPTNPISSSNPHSPNIAPASIRNSAPSSPAISMHSRQINDKIIGEDMVQDIRADPLAFVTSFQDNVLNDIRQVHSDIVNSFSSIERKYTQYFNTVNNVLLTRPEYEQVQQTLDQFPTNSIGGSLRVMAKSLSPLPTPNPSLHSSPPELPPPHTRPKYTNTTLRYSVLTTVPIAMPVHVPTSATALHPSMTIIKEPTQLESDPTQQREDIGPHPRSEAYTTIKAEEPTTTITEQQPICSETVNTDTSSSKAKVEEASKGILSWTDRVAIQRQQNSDLRSKGSSQFPDQMVGFNDDGLPIDKSTTERSTWEHRSAIDEPGDVGQRGHHDDSGNIMKDVPVITPTRVENNDERHGNIVATGGPPKDPSATASVRIAYLITAIEVVLTPSYYADFLHNNALIIQLIL
ncbi:hypothetical protein F5880DRAFT_1612454 [Lentinula raphanica]|nr:hypothetical protein F5880DRAFT_1612454 [Lentinula raphanica]